MNPIPQIRLDPDVAKKVAESAEKNSRTMPREVNRALRDFYDKLKIEKTAVTANETSE